MANYYVRSGAAGAGTGADWANAYTTLTLALSGKTNADTLWVANDHNESTAGAVTLTMPTTPGLKILGVDTNATEPPTGLVAVGSPTANVAVGAASSAINITGFGYIYGINFLSGTNNSSAVLINIGQLASPQGIFFDNCSFSLRGANAGTNLYIGAFGASNNDDLYITIKDSSISFGATTQGIYVRGGRHTIQNLSIDSAGSTPTTLFFGVNDANSITFVENSDLSGEAFTNLVSQAWTSTADFTLRNCKLPSGINVVTGTHTGPGGLYLKMHNCDSTDTNYRFAEHSWQGSIVNQVTTRIRTGGAEDAGGTAYSWLMTGGANAEAGWDLPLYSPELSIYNTTVGSAITVTVEILRDNATNLQDDEVWIEVDYLGTSGFPKGTRITDRMTDVFSTPADQTTSSVTWDTTGMVSANKQKLAVTFTPEENGYIHARVALAKNTSIYVDPYITIS